MDQFVDMPPPPCFTIVRILVVLLATELQVKCCSRTEDVIRNYTLGGQLLKTFGEPGLKAKSVVMDAVEASSVEGKSDGGDSKGGISKQESATGSREKLSLKGNSGVQLKGGSDVASNKSENPDGGGSEKAVVKNLLGQFNDPFICSDDSEGSILIADYFNDRLQVMTAAGEFSRVPLDPPVVEPNGAVLFNDVLYVTSGLDKHIYMFNQPEQIERKMDEAMMAAEQNGDNVTDN